MAEQTTTKATAGAPAADLSPADATHAPEAGQAQPQPAPTTQPTQETGPSASAPAKTDSNDGKAAITASAKGKEKDLSAPEDPLSIDRPQDAEAATSPPVAANPTCNITLLLPTGARHPYKIDERYLSKRNVEIPELTEDGKRDPFSISVYKLKELILLEWREEWEGKPASPTSIRLIHFGKLLDDKEQLKSRPLSFSPYAAHPDLHCLVHRVL